MLKCSVSYICCNHITLGSNINLLSYIWRCFLAWTAVICTQKSLKQSLICCKRLVGLNEHISAEDVCARCNMLYCICVQILTEEWFIVKWVSHINWNCTLDDQKLTDEGRKLYYEAEMLLLLAAGAIRCVHFLLHLVHIVFTKKITTPESDVIHVLWLFHGYGDKLIVSRG